MGLMSFVGSVCRGAVNLGRSAVNTVSSVASSAFHGVVSVVVNVASSMMESCEAFIGGEKNTIKSALPYVVNGFNKVKNLVLNWNQKEVNVLVESLEKFGEAVSETFTTFIEWISNLFNRKKEVKQETSNSSIVVYTAEDEEEEQKSASYKVLMQENRSKLSGQELKMLDRWDMLNSYLHLNKKIKKVLAQNTIDNFEHYLRLTSVQKLLDNTEKLLGKAIDIDTLNDDHIFIINVASELMKDNPTLSDDQLDRLNGIVYQRFNKELIPFVFEEMIKAWSKELSELDKQWQDNNKTTSKKSVMLKRLENNLKFDIELDDDEMAELEELRRTVPQEIKNQKDLFDLINSKQYFIFAGEGLLQVLEANEKLQGREYLTSQISVVGKIIIDCAQHGKKWDVLNSEEQNLVINFANIFRADAMERGELLTVENAG